MPEIPKQSKNKPILLALLLMLLIAAGVGVVYKFFPPHVEPRNLSGPIGIVVSRKAQLAGPVQDFPVFHGDAALTGFVEADIPDKPDVLWRVKIGEGLPIKSSPVIGGGLIFLGSYDNNLYALNFKDGSVAWKGETGGSIDSSPCYADGKVFVGSGDRFIYAFDARDGKPLWKFETGDGIKGGLNYSDGKVIVGSYDDKLYCFDVKKGPPPLWFFETSNKINGTPAIANGKTIFGGCDGMLHVLSIGDGKEIKSIDAGAVVAASPALEGSLAYVGTHEGELIAADLDKGTVVWRFKSPKDMAFDSSPALSKEFAVVGCDDKLLHCLRRNGGDDKREAWSFAAKGKISSSPVIARDRIIVGDEKGRVYLLALKDGTEIWNYEVGAGVDTSPAIANNVFIFGADDGSVTAFGKKE